ncbi:TPA: hypothetical protein I7721_16115 [Vibrio vulnificus]|nr:hypothetical protein [Vibrio vulnificus]
MTEYYSVKNVMIVSVMRIYVITFNFMFFIMLHMADLNFLGEYQSLYYLYDGLFTRGNAT